LRSHLLPLPGMGLFHVFLLLNFISSFLWNPQISNCNLCMHATQAGIVVTRTLLFHTYYSCAGTSMGHAFTTIPLIWCAPMVICLNPTYCPREQWLDVWSIHNPGNFVSHTQVFNPDKPLSLFFDTYVATDQGGFGGIGCGCGSLAWETVYTSNYM
jgi:hypothetical protein